MDVARKPSALGLDPRHRGTLEAFAEDPLFKQARDRPSGARIDDGQREAQSRDDQRRNLQDQPERQRDAGDKGEAEKVDRHRPVQRGDGRLDRRSVHAQADDR